MMKTYYTVEYQRQVTAEYTESDFAVFDHFEDAEDFAEDHHGRLFTSDAFGNPTKTPETPSERDQ